MHKEYSVQFNANFLVPIVLIFVLYFVFIVGMLVFQHHNDASYSVEFDEEGEFSNDFE